MTILAFTDGASRNNPGESGIGFVLTDEQGNELYRFSSYIGSATNNVAEYTALLTCLKVAPSFPCSRLIVHSDSELMVRQMEGVYKVKDPTLKRYVQKARKAIQSFPFPVEFRHVRREDNRDADRLANAAIDSRRRVRPRVAGTGVASTNQSR